MSSLIERRDRIIEAAVASNRIPPERADYWRGRWAADPVAVERLLAELAPGIPTRSSEANAEEGLPSRWFGGRQTRAAGRVGGPGSSFPGPSPAARAVTQGAQDDGGLPWVPKPGAAQAGRVTFARDEGEL